MSRSRDGSAHHPILRWRVIVPVKRHALAKSRLIAPTGVCRADLAQAMARDTVLAAAQTVGAAAVLVVTSEPSMRPWACANGIAILTDQGHGLNQAVRAGLSALAPAPVAVLLGDLPALRSPELSCALRECAAQVIACVPDHMGTGTVLLSSTGPDMVPRFGPGSAANHEQLSAAVRLDRPWDGLRLDVDDSDDLARAVELGLGRYTRAVLSRAALAPDSPTSL